MREDAVAFEDGDPVRRSALAPFEGFELRNVGIGKLGDGKIAESGLTGLGARSGWLGRRAWGRFRYRYRHSHDCQRVSGSMHD